MIEKYRDSLEDFVFSQIIGPGFNGNRIVDIKQPSFKTFNIESQNILENTQEIVSYLPTGLYSSGILFPIDNSNDLGGSVIISDDKSSEDDQVPDQDDLDVDLIEDNDLESDVLNDINQMYPNQMGFSCAVDEQSFLKKRSIELNVNTRYYEKVKKTDLCNLGVLLPKEIDIIHFNEFLSQFGLNEIILNSNEFNHAVSLKEGCSINRVSDLKILLRDVISKGIAVDISNELTLITKDVIGGGVVNFSTVKLTIYRLLRKQVTCTEQRKQLFDLSQQLEVYENYVSLLNQLFELYIGGYGVWKSIPVNLTVKISDIDFPLGMRKKAFVYQDKDLNVEVFHDTELVGRSLKDLFIKEITPSDFASISLNFQLTRNTKELDSKIYLKFQLLNTSSPFRNIDGRYYSVFTEQVSQKSFLGVELAFKESSIVEYNNKNYSPDNDGDYNEDVTTKFTYHSFENFGIGHGCSVQWINELKILKTTYIPICETPDVDPEPKSKYEFSEDLNGNKIPLKLLNSSNYQSFKWLSSLSDITDQEVISGLRNFVGTYGQWIDNKRDVYKTSNHIDLVKQELDKCEADYRRMLNNIDNLLAGPENKQNLKVFRTMNTAMLMQLWHGVKTKDKEGFLAYIANTKADFSEEFYQRIDDRLFGDEPACWRAFQLAFILLNLDGVFQSKNDPDWVFRNNLVDLVWFPTGGGKTEAYLGLIALTVINRRLLHGRQGGGTAAFMRYTLRLLTTQQFQRATLLIMALELIRRWQIVDMDLGEEPISIGLWVGNNSLPNTNEDLIKLVRDLNEGHNKKLPFSSCPWCNSDLKGEPEECKENDVFLKGRILFSCVNKYCSFSDLFSAENKYQGPIYMSLSDENIYQHPPTLLFGTVDKFAQLAHKVDSRKNMIKSDSRRIFGVGNWEANRSVPQGYLPPDLIIQDELHLLVGPLGSAAGLFETAIDLLATREDGTRAKVISSTATTRNTQSQIAALFGRDVSIFPKPGVEADDSFFAFYKRVLDKQGNIQYLSKRKYLGFLPTGRTQVWMQFRLAALALVQRAIFENKYGPDKIINFELFDKNYVQAIDYYYSVIAYFNSLKEVGKTQAQIQTYLLKEVRKLFSNNVSKKNLLECFYTYDNINESELTGRLTGEEVVSELERVKKSWTPDKRFAYVLPDSEELRFDNIKEYIVATNMISVGLDVSRFNTIIMNSMPRNTAEYIQASSRVGRDKPGIVFTVHHPFKSRDVSHYEKFNEFHQKMYSYVEPISITPFTKKALKKYLGLYLATMTRHSLGFPDRDGAGTVTLVDKQQMISTLIKPFLQRQETLVEINPKLVNLLDDAGIQDILEIIEKSVDYWIEKVRNNEANGVQTVFKNVSSKSQTVQDSLYISMDEYGGNYENDFWRIPESLRIVEPEAVIKINI